MSELNLHIWYLIFLELDTRHDLQNICLVSKLFNALATPILYRSVILRTPTPSKEWRRGKGWFKFDYECTVLERDETRFPSNLLGRLLDDSNRQLRKYIREVILEKLRYSSPGNLNKFFERYGEPDIIMARLVEGLPNLQTLVLHESLPLSESFQDALISHKNAPSLHLLNENGTTLLMRQMPCVRSLRTSFPVRSASSNPAPQPSLDLPGWFETFPNLASLSIELTRGRDGPIQGGRWSFVRIQTLQLPENETFPPLENLSLSGYDPSERELLCWKEKFPWSKLKSLSLGPIHTPGFLSSIIGCAQNLSSFTISAYNGSENDELPELERFLMSFGTLESLTIRGYCPSIGAVTYHSSLQRLTVHTLENQKRERKMLDPEDMFCLDQQCPELQFLEIDIRRTDEWPERIIDALATGFTNLCQLRLHVGLEIYQKSRAKSRAKLEPILDYSSAQDFGQAFFRRRKFSTKLELIVLKTGEKLRHYPGVAPDYTYEEIRVSRMFHIWPPRTPSGGFEIREMDVEVDEF